MKKIYYSLSLLILLVIIFVGCSHQKEPTSTTSEHKVHSISDTSNIPKSYEECSKQMSYISNNLVCYYDFIIQNKDNLWNYCEENGRVLPPNPPNPSACRLSYYNPESKVPENFDECLKIIQSSHDLVDSRAGTKACQLEFRMEEKTMTPEIKNKFFKQCSKLNNESTDNYCHLRFFK